MVLNIAEAAQVEYQAIKPRQFFYTFREACKSQKLKILELITSNNLHSIDCMGTVIEANSVCMTKEKEMLSDGSQEDLHLLRSFVREDKKDIVCEFGDGAQLSLICENDFKDYCKNPRSSCYILKKIYSAEIPLWKFSTSDEEILNDDPHAKKTDKKIKLVKELNCYFSKNDPSDILK